jgi:uncharacterized protein (UPF0335 family)
MRIKLFESFSDENKIKSDIKDIFVEFIDSGFDVNVITYFTKHQYYVNIQRIDKELFDVDIIKEYDLMLRDYLQDVLPVFKIEYLLYSNNGEYATEYEIGSGYVPRLVIKVIGQDENS